MTSDRVLVRGGRAWLHLLAVNVGYQSDVHKSIHHTHDLVLSLVVDAVNETLADGELELFKLGVLVIELRVHNLALNLFAKSDGAVAQSETHGVRGHSRHKLRLKLHDVEVIFVEGEAGEVVVFTAGICVDVDCDLFVANFLGQVLVAFRALVVVPLRGGLPRRCVLGDLADAALANTVFVEVAKVDARGAHFFGALLINVQSVFSVGLQVVECLTVQTQK